MKSFFIWFMMFILLTCEAGECTALAATVGKGNEKNSGVLVNDKEVNKKEDAIEESGGKEIVMMEVDTEESTMKEISTEKNITAERSVEKEKQNITKEDVYEQDTEELSGEEKIYSSSSSDNIVTSLQVTENYSGYYIGMLTNFSDGLDGTLEIDHNRYEMTESCEYSSAVHIWLESKDKTVICQFVNGKINRIDAIKDVIRSTVEISCTPDSFAYQGEKYINDTVTLNVKIESEIIESSGYSEELLKEMKKEKIKICGLWMNINSEQIYFTKNNSHNLSTDVSVEFGETKVYSYKIKINDGYVPGDINTNVTIDSQLMTDMGKIVSTNKSYIRVVNINLQNEKEKTSSIQTSLNKTVATTKTKLEKKVAVALDSNISYYFSNVQQKEIEQYLTVWLAEIIGVQSFKQENLDELAQKRVREKILDKLGVSYKSYFNFKTSHATTVAESKNLQGKRQKVRFTVDISNYSLDENSSAYASFGQIEYEVIGKDKDPSIPTTGIGIITFTDIKSFSEQVKAIANEAIKGAYSEVWGASSNKVASLFVNMPIEKLLSGKFSNNVYKLLEEPTKNYLKKVVVKCPVDINIYDWDGKLCGSITNNEIDAAYDTILLNVSGDEKNIYLTEGDYVIEMVGNDIGEMEVDIEEYVDGERQRVFETTSIPLYKGREYYEVIPDFYLEPDMVKLYNSYIGEIDATRDNEVWNGEIANQFAGGDGSQINPYQISNGAELAKLAEDVNSGNSYTGKYFVITQDIDLNEKAWTPIGYWRSDNDYSYFRGNLDGNNYQISNMKISSFRMSGLFGEIEGATICNVNICNAEIEGIFAGGIAAYVESGCAIKASSFTGKISVSFLAGGIAGYIDSNSEILNCKNYGNIIGNNGNDDIGGIVGSINGAKIEGCINAGIIEDSESGGGIGGRLMKGAIISNCLNRGDIEGSRADSIGGIIGIVDDGTIFSCKNYGQISISSSRTYIGGIIGTFDKGIVSICSNYGTIYSDGSVVGGICGDAYSTLICNSENYGDITGSIAGGISASTYSTNIINTSNFGNIYVRKKNDQMSGGGLIGDQNSTYIANSYSVGKVSGEGSIGTLFGIVSDETIENCFYLADSNNDVIGRHETSDSTEMIDVHSIDKKNLINELNKWVISKNSSFCMWSMDEAYNLYPCLKKTDGHVTGNDLILKIGFTSAEVSKSICTYDGTEKKPSIIVKCGNRILKKNIDYAVKYSNNVNIGTATAIITGKGNFEGSLTETFKIQKGMARTVTISKSMYAYDGKPKKPSVIVRDNNGKIIPTANYTVIYSKNVNAGTAIVTVNMKNTGNYTGTLTKRFTIGKAVNNIKVTANYNKTASTKKQSYLLGAKATSGTITYKSSNKSVQIDKKGKVTIAKNFVGKATITLTAGGKNYKTITKKVTITVNPRATKIISVKNSVGRKVNITWAKIPLVSGYQVQYGAKSNFSGAKKVTISGAAKGSKTITKLNKGKKYYIRVRAYKTIGKKKIYGKWSTKKCIKIAK